MNLKTLILFSTAAFFASCQSEGTTSANPTGSTPTNAGNAPDLTGSWAQGCTPEDDYYSKSSINYANTNFNVNVEVYTEATCSTLLFSSQTHGTYSVGNPLTLNNGQTVYEINYTNLVWSMALMNPEFVTQYNSKTICGNSNWQKGVAVDVTNCQMFGFPNAIFDIYKIDGNNLFFGDEETASGETEQDRPTILEPEFFTKN